MRRSCWRIGNLNGLFHRPIAPGVPPCSPCQSRRRATEQRETSQTAGQRLDSGLVDEDQELSNELNCLTEDDLPSEIPRSDVALRELEEFLHQNQQDPGPNSGSDAPNDSA